jgi:hypothetical protein
MCPTNFVCEGKVPGPENIPISTTGTSLTVGDCIKGTTISTDDYSTYNPQTYTYSTGLNQTQYLKKIHIKEEVRYSPFDELYGNKYSLMKKLSEKLAQEIAQKIEKEIFKDADKFFKINRDILKHQDTLSAEIKLSYIIQS